MFTGQRPGRFGEGDPHVTTVPVFMRLREHHCISPQVPIPAGGRGDGFDDGLHNAWMPKIHIRETQGDAFVTDQHGNKATYHTFVPGAPSIHSEETCTHCIKRRLAADEEMRVRSAALADADMDIPPPDAEMEDVFTRVGLGRGHECEDTEMEDDADDSDAESDAGSTDSYEAALSEPPTILTTCSGIQDLLLTGEVRSSPSFYSYSVADGDNIYRPTLVTAKRGIIIYSTAASACGTDLSPSSVFPVPQRVTRTGPSVAGCSRATSSVHRTSSGPGAL